MNHYQKVSPQPAGLGTVPRSPRIENLSSYQVEQMESSSLENFQEPEGEPVTHESPKHQPEATTQKSPGSPPRYTKISPKSKPKKKMVTSEKRTIVSKTVQFVDCSEFSDNVEDLSTKL